MSVCETCGDPIVRIGATSSGLGVYDHDGDPADHAAVPQPTCHKCGSADWTYYETNWGYGWRCGACRNNFYMSLGD